MDIHKPKPWHGLREFLKEYAIIVVGVLTALGAEQAVEWLHWRHVVQEQRVALKDEVEGFYYAMLGRADLQDCVEMRLTDIATILKRHDAGQLLGITGPVGRPTEGVADLSVYEMALANQAFSHMAFEEQEKYFDARGSYLTFKDTTMAEREVWQALGSLDRAQTFTPGDWSDFRKAYDRAVDLNEILKNDLRAESAGQWLTPFKSFEKPKNASYRFIPRVRRLCQPMIARG
jgi:hypothetical protein